MQRKLLWTIIGALVIVIFGIYYFLGGFQEVNIEVTRAEHYRIAGNYYEGPYERDTIATLFFTARELLKSKTLSGDLSVVNFDENSQDTVKMFIGILLPHNVSGDLEDLQIREIKSDKILRARIESHSIVMPTREKIEGKLQTFAEKNNLVLRDFTLERYISDNKLIIEKFIVP